MIVLDSSVVLAAAFNDPGAPGLADLLLQGSAISTVNLCEVVTKLQERGFEPEGMAFVTLQLRDVCHPLTISQAIRAGQWRKDTRHLGLSLGDRCCLALGLELGAEVYTAERRWAALDLGVKVRVIR